MISFPDRTAPSFGEVPGRWSHRRSRLLAAVLATTFLFGVPHGTSRAQNVPGIASSGSEAAKLAPVDQEKRYLVQSIDGALHTVTDGVYMAMFLVYGTDEDGGVVMVDAPPTINTRLITAIRDVTDRPITHLVYTHDHTDHIGAARLFEGATRIAHARTGRILTELGDPRRPAPDITFEDSYTLTVGERRLRLDYRGPNHTPGNIFVHDPDARTLMLVDVVFPGWMPFKNLGIVQDVPGYIEAFDEALTYEFDTFVGGHVSRAGTRADVETARDFIRDLEAVSREVSASLPFGDYARDANTRNPWQLYNGYQDELTRRCVERIVPRWVDRLSGTETYAPDNCWTMIEAVSVDLPPEPDRAEQ